MNSTISRTWSFAVAVLLSAVLLWAGSASALTMITAHLDFGATGGNVTSLQQFLAADVSVYPQGIVCGGSAATTVYGRVGPRTLAAINASIGGVVTGDVSAPLASGIVAATTSASATFTWTTNEPARGTIYYSSSPLAVLEGAVGIPAVIGGQAVMGAAFGFNPLLSVTGLSSNTTYYFASKSEDASGNVQLTWPSFIRTGQ